MICVQINIPNQKEGVSPSPSALREWEPIISHAGAPERLFLTNVHHTCNFLMERFNS